MDWLQKYIFPAEAKTVSPEFVRIGTRLAALEMIESGTTTYADMYYFEEEIAKVTREAGLRGVLGQTIIQFPVADAKTPAEGLVRAEAFIKAFKDDGLIVPAVAPHAMYTNDRATLVACAELGRRYGVPIIIHLAETEDEVRIAREQHRSTPTAYLEAIGFLGTKDAGSARCMGHRRGHRDSQAACVGVAHNPESNMKLASGAAPVKKYLAAGVTLGLGTDGAASNNDQDMFEAMRQASFLAKHAEHDPTVLPAAGGARPGDHGGGARPEHGARDRIAGARQARRPDRRCPSIPPDRRRSTIPCRTWSTRRAETTCKRRSSTAKVLMKDRQLRTLDRTTVIADARRLAQKVREAVGR